jgi:four helix bundle protein
MILSKLYISLREAKETNFWIEKFQHDKIISEFEQHSLKIQCNQVIRELYAFIKFIKKRQ